VSYGQKWFITQGLEAADRLEILLQNTDTPIIIKNLVAPKD